MSAAIENLDVPRSNGELVFQAPWESRAFGMAVALHEDGAYEWDAFRDRLIAEISAAPDDGSAYYQRWLLAFERLLLEEGFVDQDSLERRVHELDHGHEHEHEHEHEHH